MTNPDYDSMENIIQLAILAMAARAVAADQFEKTDSAEIDQVVISVRRPELGGVTLPVTVEFLYRAFVVGEIYL